MEVYCKFYSCAIVTFVICLAGIGIAAAVAVAVIFILLGLCCCWLARQVEQHFAHTLTAQLQSVGMLTCIYAISRIVSPALLQTHLSQAQEV